MKIEAKDLRIGNLTDSGEIDGLLKNSAIISGIHVHITNIKPIPLTEEWLLKFGFKSSCNYNTHFFKYEDIDNNIRGDVFCFNIDRHTDFFNKSKTLSFAFKPFGLHLKYVHELQNLYYALTKKELEIK